MAASGRRLAAIDVGTNSVLLTVAEAQEGELRPLAERAEITRLGRGVDQSGQLSEEGQKATLRVLGAFAEEALSLGVELRRVACVATSAARDASNGPAFLEKIRAQCGLAPEIIDGAREAQLTFLAARRDFGGRRGPLAVCDIGGGSTEIAIDLDQPWGLAASLDVGSVRLHERHGDDRAGIAAAAQQALARLPGPATPFGGALIGVAGTWTTLATLALELPHYVAERVHGSRLSLTAVEGLAEKLWGLSLPERLLLPGLQPGRADVIPVGAILAVATLRHLRAEAATVSDRGVRWGLLYEQLS